MHPLGYMCMECAPKSHLLVFPGSRFPLLRFIFSLGVEHVRKSWTCCRPIGLFSLPLLRFESSLFCLQWDFSVCLFYFLVASISVFLGCFPPSRFSPLFFLCDVSFVTALLFVTFWTFSLHLYLRFFSPFLTVPSCACYVLD